MKTGKNTVHKSPRHILWKILICGLGAVLLVLSVLPLTQVQAEEQWVDVGIPVEENPQLFLTRSMPTHGEGKIAVFLIAFPDCPNDNPLATREYYDGLYFGDGVETASGLTSIAEYFAEQSYGKLSISGQVFDWYTAEHDRSYYDDRKAELIMEAAEYYRAQGVDFSQFDGDGDGVLDAIVYHFAGDYSDESGAAWYPYVEYEWNGQAGGQIGDLDFITLVQIYENASLSATDLPHLICHELMHTLGMPDLYGETFYTLVALHDIMSSDMTYGVINPYTKMLLGWIDTARVITEDAQNVQMNKLDDTGDVAIVTDSYNGLFDAFYMVAYRTYGQYTTAVVWHVDARLNEDGTAFLYENLYYDPRPDEDTGHNNGITSPYLFIEELCADPECNFVLNYPYDPERSGFDADSVVGPNHFPSTDTHDGEYTGIQIYNFQEHDETHLTFDVSFVKDTSAPVITTEGEDLEFLQTVRLMFNELIYPGENLADIRATDLDGNPIDITVLIPHYPRNEMEITFGSDAYLDGYTLIFPEGCAQDSSGNPLDATTLTAVPENHLLAKEETQLPGVGEYIRSNSCGYFFAHEDSFAVITPLWEGSEDNAKLEFMRLDYYGNVLTQTIVDIPFEDVEMGYVYETGDGCYIMMLIDGATLTYDQLLCLDENGNIKWYSDTLRQTGCDLVAHKVIRHEKGLLVTRITLEPWDFDVILIHSETGEIEPYAIAGSTYDLFGRCIVDLKNGTALRLDDIYDIDGSYYQLDIVDEKTHEVLVRNRLDTQEDILILDARLNADGTIIAYCEVGMNLEAILLDAELNVVKSVELRGNLNPMEKIDFFDNDGFCEMGTIVRDNHDDAQYQVCRYDRNLNLLWEIEFEGNFAFFFRSPDGDIMAYVSRYSPERSCYIVNYGSDADYYPPHTHHYVDGVCDYCGGKAPVEILMGDVNEDGVVNYLDAMLIAQYYVGNINDTDLNLSAADMKKDGVVNYLDAMMVAQYYVGMIS